MLLKAWKWIAVEKGQVVDETRSLVPPGHGPRLSNHHAFLKLAQSPPWIFTFFGFFFRLVRSLFFLAVSLGLIYLEAEK